MKPISSFCFVLLLVLCAGAFATERERIPTPPVPNLSLAQHQTQQQSASSFNGYDGGNSYAFINIPTSATPLPATLCPKGDSESVSVLWGLFSHAKSTTRTEMECLTLVLAAVRHPEPRLPPAPAECIHPPAKPAAKANTKKAVANRCN